jgi:hypothetical protein
LPDDRRAGFKGDFRSRKFYHGGREQLIAFAGHQFSLDRPRKDGSTPRQHYAAWADKSRRPHPDSLGPECPRWLEYVWRWWCELNAARGSSGFGPQPISYGEIAAWAALTHAAPDPFDVECIVALDRCFLNTYAKPTDGH